ncbi:unnamed protein product, partial [Musa acuminata subsp. burmannicoides]
MAVGWKKSTTWVGDNCSLFLRNNHPHSSRLPLPPPPLGPGLPASPPARPAPSSLPFPSPFSSSPPLPRRSPFLVAVRAEGLRGGSL